MILDAGLAGAGPAAKRVVCLQPRRVAARTVATRVAWERQTPLGHEVGYQIRFDDRTQPGTRISFITEGVLLRQLQDDRLLSDIGALLFDEFHERNLLSDAALAIAKKLQETARPDLKIAVMSATLDAEPVANYLGGCPVVISEGQSWPVEIRYLDTPDERPVTDQAGDAVESILRSGESGDILVFMPGVGEIASAIHSIRAHSLGERVDLIPLHGELQPEEQDIAFAPNPLRKVVVATNVAETSVTIDGIKHVVDGGLARVARYDSDRGINTLNLEPISRASADQRKGRAGRTASGVCYRLWTESAHLNRPERNTPEIQRSDLAEVVLLLHSLGVRKAAQFDWLDKPDPQAVERAENLLELLGAIRTPREDEVESGGLTPLGRQMLRLPMHPRFSRMLIEASHRDCVPAAAMCAALASGRDLLSRLGRDDKHISEARELFEGSPFSDFHTLMRAQQFAKNNGFGPERCRRYGINAKVAREVDQTFEQILSICHQQKLVPPAAPAAEITQGPASAGKSDGKKGADADPLLRCIVAGFADQLAVRRSLGTLDLELAEARTASLMRESVVQHETLMVAAVIREIPGRGSSPVTLAGLATVAKREWLEELFPHLMSSTVEHLFDRGHKRVAAVRLIRFRDLVIGHEHLKAPDPEASGRSLADAVLRGWFDLNTYTHELKQFVARINLVAAAAPELEFPVFDKPAMLRAFTKAFAGMSLAKEAQGASLSEAFRSHLAPEQRAWLDEILPAQITWHDGRKVKLGYSEEAQDEDGVAQSPEAQVKLHECFGLKEHPHILEGKLPVKLWLCGPDGKRIESTYNWLAFKANTYPRLKPQLLKKYPGVGWL
ncbi:MAG: ATP-dependent RNA helicase [Verrucomicrobia bacterium]|nr:ATP-dependent RNA helicase [Verrucomicrobiota bacterium]